MPNSPFLRWSVTIASSLGAILFGFILIPPNPALNFVQHGGYYLLLLGLALLVVALIRLWSSPSDHPPWSCADLRLLGASVGFALLWQVNETHGFKVLMDELVVNATAMSMHFDREIFVPLKTHVLDGNFVVLGGILDKRPSFFPLLLSVVHDITGYRPENVFVLNGILSVVLLFLVGKLGRRLGGQEYAGLLSVALLGGLPLLGLNATGGSFEVLNLVMITGCMLLACRFLAQPDDRSQDALVLGAVLLAQTRYESALFVVAIGVLIVWAWWRRRSAIWSWSLPLAPLLLLLIPLQNKLFEVNAKGYWQLTGDLQQPFMFEFVPRNFGHAVRFLFTVDGVQVSSPVLSIAGVVCAIFVIVFLIRRWREMDGEPLLAVVTVFMLVVGANMALLMCYHWGQLDDFVATRLALPLLLLFALATAFALGRWIKRSTLWWPVLCVPTAWAFIAGVPFAARAEATMGFLNFHEVEWQHGFAREHRDDHVLLVLPSSLPGVIERKATVSLEALAERAEQMAHHLALGTYQDVYVFQRLALDIGSNQWRPHDSNGLGPEFILETVEERRFQTLFKMRLSRIKEVDLSKRLPPPEGWTPKFPPFELAQPDEDAPPAERFVRDFIMNLP